MNRHEGTTGLRTWLIALALTWAGAAPAASQQGPVEKEPDQELGEILVEGSKPIRKKPKVIDWMWRLPGRFIVDGTVEVHGEGGVKASQPVQGRVDCENFNTRPDVLCVLKIRWPAMLGPNGKALPGGISDLNAAQTVFVYDQGRIGVRYMLVDSNGIAEDALGYLLVGDTLVARRKCVNLPGDCERVVRITAGPDLKEVVMKISMEVESRVVASYTFVMHRVPGSTVTDDPRAKKAEKK